MAMREKFALDINELLRDDGHWDRKIASDLAAEVKQLLGEEPNGIPEIRRFLAVKGFRALKAHLQEQVAGQGGEAAVRAAIEGMRDFAKQRPGLSAATFRNPITDCPAWREAATELGDWLCGLLAGMAIAGMDAQHALRVIRAFVRGFVIHEMQGSFLDSADLDESFSFGLDVLVRGMKAAAAERSGSA